MIYADYKYYLDGYLCSKPGLIGKDDFPLYAKKASIFMDYLTSGRITDILAENEKIKDCCCEMVEQMYKFEKARENESGSLVASWSNDGESGTYDLNTSIITEVANKKRLTQIARSNLMQFGLLYRGC